MSFYKAGLADARQVKVGDFATAADAGGDKGSTLVTFAVIGGLLVLIYGVMPGRAGWRRALGRPEPLPALPRAKYHVPGSRHGLGGDVKSMARMKELGI